MKVLLPDLRRVLSIPAIYNLFVRVVSGNGQSRYVTEYVRPEVGDRILDIGCGPSNILEYLEGVEYVGLDLSPRYIDSARKRYGHRATFYCKKVGRDTFNESSSFDIVLANGLIHHLNDREAISFCQLARTVLRSGGRLVTMDGCYLEGQSAIARFLISMDRGEYVRTQDQYLTLADTAFPDIRTNILHDMIRIPYTHIIMDCSIDGSAI